MANSDLVESSFPQRKAKVLPFKSPEKNTRRAENFGPSVWRWGFSTNHLGTHHFCVWNHSLLDKFAFVLLGSLVRVWSLILGYRDSTFLTSFQMIKMLWVWVTPFEWKHGVCSANAHPKSPCALFRELLQWSSKSWCCLL